MSMYLKWDTNVSFQDNTILYNGSFLSNYRIAESIIEYKEVIHTDYPIYKNLQGKREMLPKDKQINPETIVKLLNIRANITASIPNTDQTVDNYYYEKAANYNLATYESTVAIIPKSTAGSFNFIPPAIFK